MHTASAASASLSAWTTLPHAPAVGETTSTTTTPSSDDEFDETTVTPGWEGFLVAGFIAAATVLLVIDMTRRIRRVRYRDEVNRELDAEQADSEPHAPER